MSRARSLGVSLVLAAATAALGCGHAGGARFGESDGRLSGGFSLLRDPTLHGARLVPEIVESDKSLGNEPGGGVRGIANGVRIVTLPSGAVLAAEDRLPQAPRSVTSLPERLGGGFAFVLGTTVWRASSWLSRARPLFVAQTEIAQLLVGLDRVYVQGASGAMQAIDPRTGAPLDMGPWPASPHVASYAALDGWRAVAIADLRGVIATFDAGATWTPLALPVDAERVVLAQDAVDIKGVDTARKESWFEVRPDGQVGRIAPPVKTASADDHAPSVDPLAKPFGKRPLLAAIEDGWPLADGTAVVARDGELARIRLADGAIAELEPNAYALKPSRCHPVPLGPRQAAGFGFVCGEPRGRTTLYTFDARTGRMIELRSFASPRAVLASGNGALAVRGGCGDDETVHEDGTGESYCLFPVEGASREVELRGAKGGERVVVLGDGRLAVISPPHGDLGAARLTLLDHDHASTRPIVFPPPSPDVARVLRSGMWLDGFWEKRPGVLGGWVESQGTVLGIEVDLDGPARAGAFVRDAGNVLVSQSYGLGFTSSRHGYETLDGGVTWTQIDLPDPISHPRTADPSPVERGCGPIGCVLAGWLRVGWGSKKEEPMLEPKSSPRLTRVTRPDLALTCEPVRGAPTTSAAFSIAPTLMHGDLISPWGSFGRSAPLMTLDWSPLYGSPAPTLRADELGFSLTTGQSAESNVASGALSRVYAWGAKGTEWDRTSRWTVRWIDPFGSSMDVHATSVTAAPRMINDASRFATGTALRPISSYAIAVAEDPRHALLVVHRGSPAETVGTVLEADRAPVEIRRVDGEPFPDVQSATRLGGHWYLATSQGPGELPATVVWIVEGGSARELARVPRTSGDARAANVRLARRSDGRALGIVVDGQPSVERGVGQRFVLGIDADTGATSEIESLGETDFGGQASVVGCTGDEPGWLVDVPWSSSAHVQIGAQATRGLRAAHALLRVSRGQACVEAIAGSLDGGADGLARSAPMPARGEGKAIELSAYVNRSRYAMKCVAR